jgi:tRNA C32,U32 (ribose-2'-O)-methylase TrmJ
VRIPLRGKVQSLNVSASAAIVLYEVLRQREQANHAAGSSTDSERTPLDSSL